MALDVDSEQEALALTEALKAYVGAFKVGLQLFTGGSRHVSNWWSRS